MRERYEIDMMNHGGRVLVFWAKVLGMISMMFR